MDDPTTIETYLGCTHRLHERKLKTGEMVTAMEWDMECQFKQGLDRYKELAKIKGPLPKADTPFLAEENEVSVARAPAADTGLLCPWCRGCFPHKDFKEVRSGKISGGAPALLSNKRAGSPTLLLLATAVLRYRVHWPTQQRG